MNSPIKFWLVVGRHINWLTAFDYGYIWGLKESQRRHWEALTENRDLIFFYVTTPVVGVVGYGIVRTKLIQASPLWPEERYRNEVIWPLRFEFDVLSAIPPGLWKDQRIVVEELKIRARGGFQPLERGLGEELIRALPGIVPQDFLVPASAGVRARPLLSTPPTLIPTADPHGHTQQLLVEIGRLQKFIADPEYPLENRRIDVVWRRVQRSVPSYAFEVQIGGNLTEAMGKLKQARDLWNSNIYLVGKEEHQAPVQQLLGGTFHEVRDRLRFIELSQVAELYQRKRAYREFEHELGILA